jgi:ribosomal protein S9
MAKLASEIIQENKVNSIEHTIQKCRVRSEIAHQQAEVVSYYANTTTPITHVHGATLCAENGYFENQMVHLPALKGTKVTFNCAEMTRSIALEAIKNLPEGSRILHGMFSELFTEDFKENNYTLHKRYKEANHQYNFIWADYCSTLTRMGIKEFSGFINNHLDKGGIAYATFCIKCRKEGGYNHLLKEAFGRTNKKSIQPDVLAEATAKEILKQTKKSKTHLIYKVVYGGGTYGNTTMITIGVAKGIAKSAVTPIEGNRLGEGSSRNTTFYNMSERKVWNPRPKDPNKKAYNSKITPAIRKEIEKLYKQGIPSVEIAEKVNAKLKTDLTTRNVGSATAWMNKEGKLANKRVNT